jgi:hypothetical protein
LAASRLSGVNSATSMGWASQAAMGDWARVAGAGSPVFNAVALAGQEFDEIEHLGLLGGAQALQALLDQFGVAHGA